MNSRRLIISKSPPRSIGESLHLSNITIIIRRKECDVDHKLANWGAGGFDSCP
jgi:hypothetical protein